MFIFKKACPRGEQVLDSECKWLAKPQGQLIEDIVLFLLWFQSEEEWSGVLDIKRARIWQAFFQYEKFVQY